MKPKYNEGDYVICVLPLSHQNLGSFTNGKIYRVGGKYHHNSTFDNSVSVQLDDNGKANGWGHQFFVHIGANPDLPELVKVIYGIP